MAARSPSDSQLQAQLTQHQQLLLSAGLNGTTEKARADLAEAICRGLNLQEFSKLVEHLQQPDDTTNLRVVMQRSRKDPAWIRKNIQRGSAVGNPFPIKSDDGKQIRTPAEATALFRPWLAEQLADPTSKQSKWIAEVQGLLAEGHRIELGCCAHADCHGHHLIEVLQEVRQMAHPTTSTAAQGESDVTVPADDDAAEQEVAQMGHPTKPVAGEGESDVTVPADDDAAADDTVAEPVEPAEPADQPSSPAAESQEPNNETPHQAATPADDRIDWPMARQHLELHGFAADELVVVTFFPPRGSGLRAEHRHYPAALPEQHGATSLEGMQRWLDQHPGYSLGFVIGHGTSSKKAGITGVSAIPWEDDSEASSREDKVDQWRRTDLPQPTYQVDTGGKSIHHWYRLAEPCSKEAYGTAQKQLTRHIKGKLGNTAEVDSSLSDASQVMRLAGGIHPVTGQRTTLLNTTGELFTLPQLMKAAGSSPQQDQPKPEEERGEQECDEWFGRLPIHKQIETLVSFAQQDKWPRRGGPAGTHAAGHWGLIPKLFGALLEQFGSTEEVVRLFSETTWAQEFDWSEVNGGSMQGMLDSLKGGDHPAVGTLVWLATRKVDDANRVLSTPPAKLPKGVIPPREPASADELEVGATKMVQRMRDVLVKVRAMRSPSERSALLNRLKTECGLKDQDFQQMLALLYQEDRPKQIPTDFDGVMAMATQQRDVVEKVICTGGVTLVCSRGGVGKSVLGYSLCETTSWGHKFAGQFQTTEGATLCIQADENHVNASKKWKRMGLNPKRENWKVEWSFNLAMLPELEQWITDRAVKLVVIDSLGKLCGDSRIQLIDPQASWFIYELNELAARTDCAIVLMHHLVKADKKVKTNEVSMSDVFGSAYISNAASTIYGLWRDEAPGGGGSAYKMRVLKDRDDNFGEGTVLLFKGNTEDFSWTFDSIEGCEVSMDDLTRLEDKVIRLLQDRSHDTALSLEEMVTQVGSPSMKYLRRCVAKLHDTDRVRRLTVKGKGRGRPSYLYFNKAG